MVVVISTLSPLDKGDIIPSPTQLFVNGDDATRSKGKPPFIVYVIVIVSGIAAISRPYTVKLVTGVLVGVGVGVLVGVGVDVAVGLGVLVGLGVEVGPGVGVGVIHSKLTVSTPQSNVGVGVGVGVIHSKLTSRVPQLAHG